MHKIARKVSGHMPVEHPDRLVSEEYTKLIAELHFEYKYPMTEIGRAVGVSGKSIRWRLVRWGYLKPFKSEETRYAINRYKGTQTPYGRRRY